MHFSDVLFGIKNFLVQLANQNVLQYWDNEEPNMFTKHLCRSIFMIFGKTGSFGKVSNSCKKWAHIKCTVQNESFPSALS